MQKILTKKLTLICLAWILASMPSMVWAVACNAIFSNGIQATGATGNISLSYHSLITGGSATLKTKTLSDFALWPVCSGSNCVASGTPATTSTVPFSITTGVNGAISLGYATTLSKPAGNYSTVNVGILAALTFTTANGTYKTGSFTTDYQSVVELQAGDYWINGNLTIGNETVLRRIAASGTTRIWVKGNVSMGYRTTTQNFGSNQLLIYATGSFFADNESKLSAFIYAGGTADFDYLATLNGAISGSSFIASGNEITVNYQPSSLITADFTPFCTSSPAGPDHYELQVASSSIACLGADVTVRACADSAVPCTQDTSVSTNVTLGTSAGALNATTLTLASGAATTKLKYGTATDGATAVVSLSGEVTAATNARKCCTGTSSCALADSCTITFRKAGFIFPGSLSGTTDSIPTQVAGVASNSVASPSNYAYIRAVQTSSAANSACLARFTAPQLVPMAYQCVNPSTCVAGQTLSVNGTSIPGYLGAGPVTGYTDVSFNFDANGNAPVALNYSDVGQIHLLANLALPLTTNDPAYTMLGQSNDFVVRPYSTKVSAVTTSANVANPAKTNEAGAANNFVSAGTAFKVSVQATNAGGTVTPNFGNESTSQSQLITLATNSLVYPVGGSATALSYTASSFLTNGAGTATNSTVVWPQVGSMTIMPGLSNYLATGSAVSGVASGTIGRFYPDHFRVVPASTSATNGCGAFTYMGQSNINLKPYVVAESAGASPTVLSNYDNKTLGYGGTASLALPVYAAEDSLNGTSLSSRITATVGTWSGGIYNGSLTGTFARSASGAPDGPYTSLRIGISAMADTAATPYDLVGATQNTPSSAAKDMLGGTAIAFKDPTDATKYLLNLRYGRLRLDDAFGPETYLLNVNFSTEYWAGNRFAFNSNDSCTQVPRSAITYPSGAISTDTNRTVALTGGSTVGTYTNLTATDVGFTAGTAGQKFTSPSGGKGRFVVGINLTALPWLRYDWKQNGNYAEVQMPNATFEFGSYRGHDRIIYWRERLQ